MFNLIVKKKNKQLVGAEKPMGVFLYLQPKAIMYPKEDNALINIVMEHPLGPITRLSNKYKPENVINVNKFDSEKPTFSITIKQDGLADVEECIDSPLILTLYEQEIRDDISETSTESRPPHKYQGRAIAQGHMDLIQYFTKKRIMLNVNVFLYPLNPREDDVTCKMVWDVYSLMPLLKTVNFSNILFITLTSIYNIDGSFLDDYQNLASTFWLRINSWSERESNDKIFICKYTGFSKQIIIEQTKYYKWENMKNAEYNNYNSMAILSGSSFNIHKIFNNLFCTENFNFNFWDVDMNNDYCLVCNSLHRFVLTDKMQTVLEQHLACGRSEIVVDIFDDSQPTNILLQGVIDLSIFMYPKITECSFAVDLNPPIELTRSSALSSPVSSGRKRSQSPQLPKHKQSEKDVGKPIFAVVKICVQVPITDPPQDANVLFNNIDPINIDMTRDVYQSCGAAKIRDSLFPTGEAQCVRSYQEFDDNVLKLRENITAGNLFPTDKDDKEKLCQTPDMSNRILSLIACDFNVRYPTNTNRDFVLKDQFSTSSMLRFYGFLYDLELEDYDSARDYIQMPLSEQDMEGQLFTNICKLYLDYIRDKNDSDINDNLEIDLLKALRNLCEMQQPTLPNAFINLTNGNIEYFRNPNDSAWIRYYASILDTENVEDTFHFQLGTLRYAAKMMEQKEYESAIRALDYASDNYNHGLFKSVAKAKALYYLGRLKEAERYLAEGTNYDLFLPNVWAGLALINLRLGENYKALECWIYARLNPDYAIDEEILDELRKIDHDNVKLYVDIPNSS
uniref:Tetratricopeptide repeat protein 18 n=1 Tax=Glossina brevipalpis TaxID=37001 RepID=A0A1A9WUQ5_9MUSC